MEVTYKVMKANLEREFNLYKRYLESCFAIRECVKESDVENVRRHVKEQENIVAAIADQESSRQLLVEEFAEQYRLSQKKVTLSKIAEHAEEPIKKELTELQHRLRSIINDVQHENKVNSVLIGGSLDYIRGTFEIIAGVQRKRDTYKADGKSPEGVQAARNILNRVI